MVESENAGETENQGVSVGVSERKDGEAGGRELLKMM